MPEKRPRDVNELAKQLVDEALVRLRRHAGIAPTPADASRKRTTATPRGHGPEQVVGFTFDFALTSAELRELSADQITALFRAVGEVMAIKASLDD